ncbi:maleylpyruvate isomerase family mycothiol-dependent enzyme [Streptomyces calidiresistens]|uniref:Maleylpyruvate isomerase family mycothiol-dependent enzyme n=1 Tax=Streptomyces calidiresistens TaxID=1485586 RepID=A0A7W3T5S1_9ACTN|nr:maleylpyruvate isomerase family mycothiol-dependent enzyme [Streptomyces calidiresistens]MBB0231271.1 maleylpyruvate isomerase family mycothiol-dependent enzyme [Streptomyces calidiresistens]
MSRPEAELAALADAGNRLLAHLDDLSDAAVVAPSSLPGWTRGHVVAHLARNADALGEVLAGRPMYASAEARDEDIERGAPRSAAEHLTDLRDAGARLEEALRRTPDDRWGDTVELRNGVTDTVSSLPWRRWLEIELHLVDLDLGYTVADLPGDFTDRALPWLARRFADHPDVEPIEIRAEDGRSWRTGRDPGGTVEPIVVTGGPTALTGWLTGRTAGTGLTASADLPRVPAL